MQTILVSLAQLEGMDESLETAISIGMKNNSHIIGYYPVPGISLIVYATPGGDFPTDDSLQRLYENRMPDIKAKFEDRMRRSGLKYEWREDRRYESDITKGVLEHGREADIIIMGCDTPGSKYGRDDVSFVADIVLGAGRPVLVLPTGRNKTFKLGKVALAWNSSRESCRAAFDSLPLLEAAEDVILTWINPDKKPDQSGNLPGSDLAAAFERHGVNISTKGLSNRSRTSTAIINYVEENDVDLLVMGAYGHSRLREQILGGVTEHILKNLPCPVLLSN